MSRSCRGPRRWGCRVGGGLRAAPPTGFVALSLGFVGAAPSPSLRLASLPPALNFEFGWSSTGTLKVGWDDSGGWWWGTS